MRKKMDKGQFFVFIGFMSYVVAAIYGIDSERRFWIPSISFNIIGVIFNLLSIFIGAK